MRSKMRFLPEGTGMVTRCPIEVQMTCPKDVFEHSASVSTQVRCSWSFRGHFSENRVAVPTHAPPLLAGF